MSLTSVRHNLTPSLCRTRPPVRATRRIYFRTSRRLQVWGLPGRLGSRRYAAGNALTAPAGGPVGVGLLISNFSVFALVGGFKGATGDRNGRVKTSISSRFVSVGSSGGQKGTRDVESFARSRSQTAERERGPVARQRSAANPHASLPQNRRLRRRKLAVVVFPTSIFPPSACRPRTCCWTRT